MTSFEKLMELETVLMGPREKEVVIPPRYDHLKFALMRRFEIRNVNVPGKRVHIVWAEKSVLNQFLKGFGYKILGFVWINGKRYLYLGKNIKPIKKKGPKLVQAFCPKCQKFIRGTNSGYGRLPATPLPNCIFCRTKCVWTRCKTIKKYKPVIREQRRCLKSILGDS